MKGNLVTEIKKAAILGANGTMGSLSGGIFAQAGIPCVFFARSVEKAQKGIENAVRQARSDVLREFIVPRSYEDLKKELSDCDWVMEAVAEELPLKREFFRAVDGLRKKGSVVSTISSSGESKQSFSRSRPEASEPSRYTSREEAKASANSRPMPERRGRFR